ncbi:MAG: RNA polymerase sigma-70 factor [Candidatus Pseudobacter hemicellulosilyticus]|uniref:RNA polymerase sigma-70 factor n=1 Tax=Candidatus Pseudobacter hemicellulosilyticus TaxID=3121375 RepID=A0AAJ5WQK0_9BACT|nr:MAG: RNA polymerase sigma-70 factor [Pseudobacter sp.]
MDLYTIQQQICRGDEQALSTLYGLYARRLLHFARLITRSGDQSEEIVEDVFVKLWTQRHRLAGIDNLAVYLYVAVKNTALNALSRKARQLVLAPFDELDIAISAVPDPHHLLVSAELLKKMQQAVDGLPPRCRMIFKLVREDGLRHREVAQILNISIHTVDVQMAIAIKKICHALQVGNNLPARSKPK